MSISSKLDHSFFYFTSSGKSTPEDLLILNLLYYHQSEKYVTSHVCLERLACCSSVQIVLLTPLKIYLK